MSLTLGREALTNLISTDLATRNTNKGLIETEVNAKAEQTEVALNTIHKSSDGTDHANMGLNDTHRTGDGSDHADVATNAEGISTNATNIALKTSKSEIAYDVDTTAFIANTLASGAIIERGSNANGNYVKFADGTLICMQNYTGTSSASWDNQFGTTSGTTYFLSITGKAFPSAFIIAPIVQATSSNFNHLVSTSGDITTTTFRVVQRFMTNALQPCSYIAIGRWK